MLTTALKYLRAVLLIIMFLQPGILFPQEKQLYLYGYGQMDFSASDKKGAISGFDQRRINLIGEFFPEEKFRILSDIEYEGGADLNVQDAGSSGTIKVSRAWFEYTFAPEFKIRAGKMLTHFGLYNLIHDASASYFPLEPPIMYSPLKIFRNLPAQRLYAKYQIGVEVLGTVNLDQSGGQMEYSLGIGNGRGAQADGTDLNNNRSVSARLIFRPTFLQGLQIGSSFYYDRNFSGLGGITNDNEFTAGADIQYENNSVQLQAEAIVANYGISPSEKRNTGIGYVQLAYTLFDIVTPYANYTAMLYDIKHKDTGFTRLNFGITWAATQYLFIKSEVQFHETEEDFGDSSFRVFKLSAAFAF